ncbi:MAG: hypothetical protein KGL39_03350 [Patescibacteria group bacterium]|nr:hypothetical protein [Patescibacteria group bacterium]
MAIALDGNSQVSVASATSSKALTLSTTSPDDIIVFVVSASNNSLSSVSSTVSGIADGGSAGVTLTKRLESAGRNTSGSLGTYFSSIEIWTGNAAAALASESFTVSFAANVSCGNIFAFGISGANTTSPFDPNASLPVFKSTGATCTISTSNANDFLLAIASVAGGGSNVAGAPSGFTQIGTVQYDNVNEKLDTAVYYEIVSATQSSAVFTYTQNSSWYSNLAMDAFEAPSGGGSAVLPLDTRRNRTYLRR